MAKKIFTRELILDKAYELAKEVGLDKLSMRGVADSLSSSVAPIYESFTNKEDLLEALFNKIIREDLESTTYFKRNEKILLYGLNHPKLYMDMRKYGPKSYYLEEFYGGLIDLMKKEERLKAFDEDVLKSLNFDITVYMNGLVSAYEVNSFSPPLKEGDYCQILMQATEVFILGYQTYLDGL